MVIEGSYCGHMGSWGVIRGDIGDYDGLYGVILGHGGCSNICP